MVACAAVETTPPAALRALLSPRAATDLRRAIEAADGNEVFAVARRDSPDEPYDEVRIVARGHRAAVPAVMGIAEYGDLALHNHPSGNLRPSEADIDVAARLADEGIGFAITDSGAEQVYVVVEPFREEEVRPISADEVRALLGDRGPVARLLDGYEARPSQLDMASAGVDIGQFCQ